MLLVDVRTYYQLVVLVFKVRLDRIHDRDRSLKRSCFVARYRGAS